MTWDPTMPTNVTDGDVIHETHLDPVFTNILDLRDSSRVIQGRVLNTVGPANVTTTETTITGLQLPSVSLENGKWYMVNLTVSVNMSVAADSYFFRVRKTTALTGAVLVSAPVLSASSGLDDIKTVVLPWQATATETVAFHVSVQRLAGTGNIDIYGGKQTAHWVEKMGDSSGVWAIT